MFIDLLVIMLVIALGYHSGFFDNIDEALNRKWRFFHLPRVIMCPFCVTHWFCLIYVIIMRQFSFNIWLYILCLCYLSDFVPPIVEMIRSWVIALIDAINKTINS